MHPDAADWDAELEGAKARLGPEACTALDRRVKQMFADTSEDEANRTVPIFIDNDFRGSGTLARVGAYSGIITAEHVINHPTDPALRIYGPNAGGRTLQTGLGAGRIAKTSFKAEHLRFVTARGATENGPAALSEAKGPDLAFIILPLGDPCISHMESCQTFTSFDKDFETRRTDALKETETLLFAGYPHQLSGRKTERRGNLQLIDYHVVTCNAKVGQTFFKNEWDYCDIDVDLEKIPQLDSDLEKVFGGVSGGGSWRQILEKDEPDVADYRWRLVFAGVAFLEIRKGNICTVRVHGPESIYRRLIPAVRQELGLSTMPDSGAAKSR